MIGGIAKEFFARIGQYYGLESSYRFEPHIAERAISDLILEPGITVYYNHRLQENTGVEKSGTAITKITTENKDTFAAKVWIDCSYEGDLMAQADVRYTYGREGTDQYGESLAGVRPFSLMHNFTYHVSAYNEKGELLPGLAALPQETIGSGDLKIQAYTFRLCLTDDPNNKQPFGKPQNYDASQYELLLEWLQVLQTAQNVQPFRLSDIFYLGKLPNSKADTNNSGPFSSDYIGKVGIIRSGLSKAGGNHRGA